MNEQSLGVIVCFLTDGEIDQNIYQGDESDDLTSNSRWCSASVDRTPACTAPVSHKHMSRTVFFNFFAAEEPHINVKITHATPCNDPLVQRHKRSGGFGMSGDQCFQRSQEAENLRGSEGKTFKS